MRRAAAIAIALGHATVALAADDVPDFARMKRRVDPVDHPPGDHVEALPAIAYDPTLGLQLGALAFLTRNGAASDALFPVTPYRHRLYAQVVVSTLGYQQHVLAYDAPYLRDTPFRLRASVAFERNLGANYFGVGEAALGPLAFQGRPHATYGEQTADASAAHGGVASPLYNRYRYEKPSATVTLERDFLGGLVRAQYGFVAQHVAVRRFDGAAAQGIDAAGASVDVTHGPTKLGLDCAARAVLGCDGGWNNLLKAGVALDTRDFEPDPNAGVLVEAVSEWSTRGLGSSFDYLRLTASARFFWSPFPRLADVVIAGRLLYSVQSARTPFFAMNTLAMTAGPVSSAADQAGLGGENTLRGFRQDRFVGRVASLGNAEVRWTFVRFALLRQDFSLQAAPLFDVGRVYDEVALSRRGWRPSYGGALRLGWNHSTIFRFDVGVSSEDTGFYFDVDTPF